VGHALALCDTVVMLDHGSTRWQGPSTDATERLREHLFDGVVT
jgi:hypothetical protein